MNTNSIALTLTAAVLLSSRALTAGEVTNAADIEKQMGLTAPAASSGGPGGVRTRGITRGAVAAPVAVRDDRIVPRSAVASSASVQSLVRRGISVVPVKDGTGRVSVPVFENAQASFKNVLFVKDSTVLADAQSTAQIAEIAQVMLHHPEQRFVVEGHTCDLGSATHNERLSVERAAAIEAALLDAGVKRDQIVALGFGESDPVATVAPSAPATDPAAEGRRQQNRRVVIRLQAGQP